MLSYLFVCSCWCAGLTCCDVGDNLILAIAEVNPNTVVIIHSVGPLILEPWIDHPNVTAVIWAGLPGQETGSALRDVLYGHWNPSGKLPFTIAKAEDDYNGSIITDSDPTSELFVVFYCEAGLADSEQTL